MAEAVSDHSGSKHTVDDLFQLLVRTRGKAPSSARRDILKQLQDGALPIVQHIKGRVRSIGPVRKPTPKARLKAKRTGIVAKTCYSTTPRKGVTLPVDPQSWEDILLLRIRGGKLGIESGCAFDYPWDAYSFTVANWSLVEELWPNPNRARSDLSALASRPEDPSTPTNPPSAAAATRSAPSESTAASEPKSGPKMQRAAWLKDYLTVEKMKELANEHGKVGKAAEAVNCDMENDPRVNAYKNPRSIEPFLIAAKMYPQRQSPK